MAAPPFEHREIAVLVGGLLVLVCTLALLRDFKRVPRWGLLGLSLASLVLGNVATVVEHFAAYTFFNHFEHAAYALQSLLLAAWALGLTRAAP